MTIPDVIYLQWYTEDGEDSGEVTWCIDRIHETDIEYRLTPLALDAAVTLSNANQEQDTMLVVQES